MRTDDILIIGAGPAGLSVAYAAGEHARILEGSNHVGGLARSIRVGEGVFDIGGHSFHTSHPHVLALVRSLMGQNWVEQRRDARVFFQGDLIPYPFQQSFHHVRNASVVAECRESMPQAAASTVCSNYEEWINAKFGAGISHHFMLPYNRKLWARDLKRMSCEWVVERVADTMAIRGPASNGQRRPLVPNSIVGYPLEGGFGRIFEVMAAKCHAIELNTRIVSINPSAHEVHSESGRVWRYNKLVSTIPLPELLTLLRGCPGELIDSASELEFVSLKILLILVGDPIVGAPQRLYVADPQVPAHKIAFNHTSSPSLRNLPVHAISAEVSFSSEKSIPADDELCPQMTDWLKRHALVPREAPVLESQVITVKYGYPVYTHERPEILRRLIGYLQENNIFSIGRFGAWEYVNSDQSIMQGLKTAENLL